MPEEPVGLVFAQADLVAYVCELGVGIYLVPSALALVDSPEHGFALVVGKLCGHYVPLPLMWPPSMRLPERTATRPLLPRVHAGHRRLVYGHGGETTSFPVRTRSLAVALVGSARFTVAGHFGAYQKQGDQRAEDGQRSAGIKRRPEALN